MTPHSQLEQFMASGSKVCGHSTSRQPAPVRREQEACPNTGPREGGTYSCSNTRKCEAVEESASKHSKQSGSSHHPRISRPDEGSKSPTDMEEPTNQYRRFFAQGERPAPLFVLRRRNATPINNYYASLPPRRPHKRRTINSNLKSDNISRQSVCQQFSRRVLVAPVVHPRRSKGSQNSHRSWPPRPIAP